MNFYQHHIGDYAAATAHLTWDEDQAYTRLIRAYYHHERPIPSDLKEACRLVRAETKAQKQAVERVLREFFEIDADGWHQKRCDAEIEKVHESSEEFLAKKENEKERKKRHRERRSQIFGLLREHDIVPKWDTSIEELEAMLRRTKDAPRTRTGASPETANDESGTANQNPESNNQNPESRIHEKSRKDVFGFFEKLWHENLPSLETGPMFYVEQAGLALTLKYTDEQLEKAIKNYATVLNGEEYFYKQTHPLTDFLKFKIFKFFDSMKPLEAFRFSEEKPKETVSKLSDEEFEKIMSGGTL